MPPNWDEDSPRLRGNLTSLLQDIAISAQAREKLSREVLRSWHKKIMRGLGVPEKHFVGAFRGEPGLETIGVRIGRYYGVAPSEVANALRRFEEELATLIAELAAHNATARDVMPSKLAKPACGCSSAWRCSP